MSPTSRHRRSVWKVLGVATALFIISSLPYVYGSLSVPPDLTYSGLMFDVPDHAQYWSWVTASRDGLFISNTMTPEPNPRVFMNPMMWGLAQLQAAFDLSFPALFQVWRASAILLFVPLLFLFTRVMVTKPDRRPVALGIALFGSGLGWVWVVQKQIVGGRNVLWPQDLYTVEPNTFFALLSYPYLLLAHALILATMVGAWLVHRGSGRKWAALAAAGAAGLSLSHAYDLITVYVVLGVFGALEWWRSRTFPRRLFATGCMIVAVSAPIATYYQLLTTRDDLWRSILGQYANAGVWTPLHVHLVILMGVPLLLAAYMLVRGTARWTDEGRFLAVWTVVGLVLIYLPVVYQIKLLSGLQFPIAAVAAHAWSEWLDRSPRSRVMRTLATAALLAVVSLTNVYLFAWRFVELSRHTSPYYLHRDQMDALAWLASHARSSDVVIATPDVGQFVPNYGASRAYLAHWAMTNRFFERRDDVSRFFRVDTPEEWRQRFLSREGVTLVLRSNWPEPLAGTFDPVQAGRYVLVFDRPEAQIFRVDPLAVLASSVVSP